MSRILVPLADTTHAAVVEAVLAVRHRMQIDQNFDVVCLGPAEGPVEIVDATDIGRVVTEDEEGDRNPDDVETSVGQVGEVPFGDVGVSMNRESLPFGDRIQVATQLRLVLGIGPREQLRAHPFFEDQPVTQVDALDHDILLCRTLTDRMHIPSPGQRILPTDRPERGHYRPASPTDVRPAAVRRGIADQRIDLQLPVTNGATAPAQRWSSSTGSAILDR